MSRRVVIAAAGATIVALVFLVPSTSGTGSEMDEGAVVAYASRVLDGAVPHRDFLTFYGPANPWIVAGAFAVAGESVTTQRVVGLAYRLVILVALFVLALRLGGVLGGVLTVVLAGKMMSRELIWAYATYGAIAFGLLALALAVLGAGGEARRQRLLYLAAGVSGGIAVLMRFEFALAVVLSAIPLALYAPTRSRRWYLGGLIATAGLYVPHLLIVGPERVQRLVGDLIATRPGRALPPPTDFGNWITKLFALALMVTLAYGLLGAYLWRRDRRDLDARILVAVGGLSAALTPSVFFRADGFHIRPFAFVTVSLLPAVALLVVARWDRLGRRSRLVVTTGVALVALYPVLNELDPTYRLAREGRGIRTATRDFFTDERASASRAVIARTTELAQPGDSLFVGPQDLRRTNYGPTYMYFLLRQLEPASYYMEMNPGTANREGSGLADDLRQADWLILTTAFDDWNEPNESMDFGPAEPNEVVRDDFCVRFERAPYRLYERCDR